MKPENESSAENYGRKFPHELHVCKRLFPASPVHSNVFEKYVDEHQSTFDYFASAEYPCTKRRTLGLWICTVLAAILIGCIKGGTTWMSNKIWDIRVSQMAVVANQRYHSIMLPMVIYIAYVLVFGIVASFVIVTWAPAAGGGGIPDIKAFLNGNMLPQFLWWRTLFGRIFGITLVASSGILVGRGEGPTAHISTIVSVLVGRYFSVHPITDRETYDFAAIGAGMGISAAFTAPLAGPLFALEEAASYWHPELIGRTFFGCFIAAIVAVIVASGFQCTNAEYCILIEGEFPLSLSADYNFSLWEIPLFVVPGLVAAMISLLMTYFIFHIQEIRLKKTYFRLYRHPRLGKWIRVADVALVFVGTAVIFSLATYLGTCINAVDYASPLSESPILSESLCSASGYGNSMSLLLLEQRYGAITSVINQQGQMFSQSELALAGVFGLVAIVFTNGLSVTTGLFVPMCLIGVLFGRLSGEWINQLFNLAIHPGVYSIACAAGVIAGVSRMTLWVAVVIVESTDDVLLAIPVMVAVIVSKLFSDWILPNPLYDSMAELKGFKIIPSGDSKVVEKVFENKTTRDLMTSPVVCLFEYETATVLSHIMGFTPFSVFPVLDKQNRLIGTAKRSPDINSLLQVRATAPTGYYDPSADILTPVSKDYLSVSQNMPLKKCYYLFSQLGVKMVVVTDDENQVVGVITRKNFLELL